MNTNSHLADTCGDSLGPIRHLCAILGASVFSVPGLLTKEECAAWFAGRPTLFDAIIEWCRDSNWSGRVWIDRSNVAAMMILAIESRVDAVMFKLRRGDHLSWPSRHAA